MAFKNKRLFNDWRASRIAKAPLYLINSKYGANIWNIPPPESAPLTTYKKIHFDPARVIHRYICEDSASRIQDLIIARHDFRYYEQTENNLISFILSIKPLVEEYVFECFQRSNYLYNTKIIEDQDFNGFNRLGLTISQVPDLANNQLMELLGLISALGTKIPHNFEKNILNFADFSIDDQLLIDLYSVETTRYYQLPRVIYYPEKTIEAKIEEYKYDRLAKPYHLPKIFQYIIKPNLTALEYTELENLINNDPYMITARDPSGVIAHELASRIADEQVFKLIYTGLGNFNALPENQREYIVTKDWEKIYRAYFKGASYSNVAEYRTTQQMEQFRKLYLSKLSEHYANNSHCNSNYDYQNDYPNLKDPLDLLLPAEKNIMKSLYLGELHRDQDSLSRILTEVIDTNDLIKFKAILFHLKTLPDKENGTFLEYILRKHCSISKEMLAIFFSYYENAYGTLFPDEPYNKNLDESFVEMLKDYNMVVKQKKQKQLNMPVIHGLPIYENFTIKQQLITPDLKHEILLLQKPLCLLDDNEKAAMYKWFYNNFEFIEGDTDEHRRSYFNQETSRSNNPNKLELVVLFYDNKNKQLISFLTITVKQSYQSSIGEFTLIHARLAANDPNYAGLNLTNIALAQMLLSEAILHANKPTYVFFKSNPPGYALCMLPFYIDFFPKNYIPYSLLEHILNSSEEHVSFTEGVRCKLKVNSKRNPVNLSFPLRFYKATIGEGVKNGMPIIFSVDHNNANEYYNLLKVHNRNPEDLTSHWLPLYVKQKCLPI